MPRRLLSSVGKPRTFELLCRGVRETFANGERQADEWKVRTYWETGALIEEHFFFHRKRAGYGEGVVPELSRCTGILERLLYLCLQFRRRVPNLIAGSDLSWGHYRRLIAVADPKRRAALAEQAIARGWKTEELSARITAVNATSGKSSEESAPVPARPLLTPRRGTPGLRLIVERWNGLSVDLGFAHYRALPPAQARHFRAGDIVRYTDDGSLRSAEGATKAELFTYDTRMNRVVDGDTFIVDIELEPGSWWQLRLRLRGLDCPELATEKGRDAKRFVDGCVSPGDRIVMATTKADKYQRYLADIFVTPGATDGASAGEPIFLNNALLTGGHAVRFDGVKE